LPLIGPFKLNRDRTTKKGGRLRRDAAGAVAALRFKIGWN
jgi:hypothetical protein